MISKLLIQKSYKTIMLISHWPEVNQIDALSATKRLEMQLSGWIQCPPEKLELLLLRKGEQRLGSIQQPLTKVSIGHPEEVIKKVTAKVYFLLLCYPCKGTKEYNGQGNHCAYQQNFYQN